MEEHILTEVEGGLTAGPTPRHAPVSFGLQGRLVVAFLSLLTLSLEASGYLYTSQTHFRLTTLLGEQAKQIAWGLTIISQESLVDAKQEELRQLGEEMIRTRNTLFVIFYDANFKPLAVAHRDPEFHISTDLPPAPMELMQAHPHSSQLLGDYVEVCAPVIGPAPSAGQIVGHRRILGYVTVGVSQAAEAAQLARINWLAGATAAGVVLASFPLVLLLIHCIIKPIRQLEVAANKIAAGSYETQVDIQRSDVIGTLARAFNNMARTIKRQQDDLAAANQQLEQKVRQRTAQLSASNEENESLSVELEQALQEVKFKNALLEEKNEQLQELAATDPLTGLYNRRHFGHVLEQLFAESSRYDADLACVMMDLDGYKSINDEFGHAVGDQLLVIAGKAIRATMRKMDVAARYGGDEFVLLLPRADGAEAATVAERLRQEFNQAAAAILGRKQGVTMSVGIASLQSGRPAGPEQLVVLADSALYQAKAAGRDRVVINGRPTAAAAWDI
jgi:diguanylate cyclase (GGDEF)-like protein